MEVAVGILAVCGHDPREIRQWPRADVLRALHAYFGAIEAFGPGPVTE